MESDTCEEIMAATYRALCEHGYAALTMQDIADASGKSKAALHYHYDTKTDLLVAFLDHLYEEFEERVRAVEADTPAERLHAVVDTVIGEETPEQRDAQFATAFLEIQAQAPYDDAFCERLAEFDRIVYEEIRDCVREGIAAGQIHEDVDPDRIASFIVTTINGANCRNVAVGYDLNKTRTTLHEYLQQYIQADGEGDGPAPDEPRVNAE